MWADVQTCVCEIDHSEEDHASSERDSKEEKCLELLSGQPVLQVLQEGIGLEKCKHTWERSHRHKHKNEQTYKRNSHWVFEEALIHVPSCRVQSRFTWLRSAVVSLAESSTKQFAIAPLAVHADVKDKYCRTTYFKCMRQICVNKPFSFPRLAFLFSQPLRSHFSPPFLCSVTFSAPVSPVRLLCLSGEFDIKNVKESWFPSLSSPPILWQILCEIAPTPALAPPPPTAGLTHFQG